MTITDTEAPTSAQHVETHSEPSELDLYASTGRVRTRARRSWRLGWLPLATPGFTALVQEVTGLVARLEDLEIEATYQMSDEELLDVVLEPSALQPVAPRISCRLKTMAAFAGVDPAVLIGWHLAASDSPITDDDQPKAEIP